VPTEDENININQITSRDRKRGLRELTLGFKVNLHLPVNNKVRLLLVQFCLIIGLECNKNGRCGD
jgi:hypothetical protein